RGVGRERLVSLRVEGPTIQAQTIYIVPRSTDEVKALMLDRRERMNEEFDPGPALYPPSFRLVANPTRLIVGKVCDARSGKPLPGSIWYVPLAGNKSLGTTPGSDFYRFVLQSTSSDKDGKFSVVVLPGFGALFGRAGNNDDNRYQQAHIHPQDRGKPYAGK